MELVQKENMIDLCERNIGCIVGEKQRRCQCLWFVVVHCGSLFNLSQERAYCISKRGRCLRRTRPGSSPGSSPISLVTGNGLHTVVRRQNNVSRCFCHMSS